MSGCSPSVTFGLVDLPRDTAALRGEFWLDSVCHSVSLAVIGLSGQQLQLFHCGTVSSSDWALITQSFFPSRPPSLNTMFVCGWAGGSEHVLSLGRWRSAPRRCCTLRLIMLVGITVSCSRALFWRGVQGHRATVVVPGRG